MRNMVGLSKAIDIISARRRLQVLCCLTAGQRKFNELKENCGGVSSAELSRVLKFLKSKGIVSRVNTNIESGQLGYELTDVGKEFSKVLYSIEKWGAKL